MGNYVTQGTVQVVLKSTKKTEILISPTQDYNVKHVKEDYIAFINVSNGPACEAKLFKKAQLFATVKNDFETVLTSAAFQAIPIELTITIEPTPPNPNDPVPIDIVSVRIPSKS